VTQRRGALAFFLLSVLEITGLILGSEAEYFGF
jgi:hypothetical protein